MELQGLGFSMIILGIILIFLGTVLLIVSSAGGEWGGGLIVFVGPFPIAIGGGKLGKLALLIAALLLIATILMMLVSFRMGRVV